MDTDKLKKSIDDMLDQTNPIQELYNIAFQNEVLKELQKETAKQETLGLNKINISGVISLRHENGVVSNVEITGSPNTTLESVNLIVSIFNSYLQEIGYNLKLEKLKK